MLLAKAKTTFVKIIIIINAKVASDKLYWIHSNVLVPQALELIILNVYRYCCDSNSEPNFNILLIGECINLLFSWTSNNTPLL